MRAQLPQEDKVRLATHVIDNDGDLAATEAQVDRILAELRVMRFVNAAIVALAALATLGGYFQEKKRLGTILALPAAAARDLYEKAQAAARPGADGW